MEQGEKRLHQPCAASLVFAKSSKHRVLYRHMKRAHSGARTGACEWLWSVRFVRVGETVLSNPCR